MHLKLPVRVWAGLGLLSIASLTASAQTAETGTITFEKGQIRQDGFAGASFSLYKQEGYDVFKALKQEPEAGYPILEKNGQDTHAEKIIWERSDNLDAQDSRTYEVTIKAKKLGKGKYFGVYVPTAHEGGSRVTYAFLITREKDFKILRVHGPDSHSGRVEVIKQAGCAFIQPDRNTFQVSRQGTVWTFSVNGTSLYQFRDEEPRHFVHFAPFGLHVEGDGELYLPSFKIQSPAELPQLGKK